MRHQFTPLPWLLCMVSLVLGAVLALSWVSREAGAQRVTHTLAGNTSAVGNALRIQIERALDVGIDLRELVNVEAWLAQYLAQHKEVSFFALLDATGERVAFRANPSLDTADQMAAQQLAASADGPETGPFRTVRTPIHRPGDTQASGWLLVGYPMNYIDSQVNAVVTDLLVAILIAVILTLELMRFAGSLPSWRKLFHFSAYLKHVRKGELAVLNPLTGDDRWGKLGSVMSQRIDRLKGRWQTLHSQAQDIGHAPCCDVAERVRLWGVRHGLSQAHPSQITQISLSFQLRMIVFLVAMSDELVRPFMAVHASQLNGPLSLSTHALAGIPLTTFLLTWAVSQPFGASLLQRFGSRTCLTMATCGVALSMLATALVTDWWALTVLRALTGMAFGCVLIFVQILLLRVGKSGGSGKAMAEFVGAMVAAGICGPVIGGLMADKLGVPATLVASALFATTACALALRHPAIPNTQAKRPGITLQGLQGLLRHRQLMILLFGSAIPGKLVATGILLLLVPMAVSAMEESPSLTGRLLLLYFLAFLLVSKWAGGLSDRWGRRKLFVVAGGLVSAAGCLLGNIGTGIWGLVALTALFGLGQAWLSSPQIVWATQMADHDPTGTGSEQILGIYRLLERLGGATGPFMVAGLVAAYGPSTTLWVLTGVMLAGSLVTWLAQHERVPHASPPTPDKQP